MAAWFWNRREEWQVDALPSYWVKVSASRVRMPDLCVVRSDEREPVRVTAPLLVLEFLEPGEQIKEVMRRLDDFIAMGVENIWLLNPSDRTGSTCSRLGIKPAKENRLQIKGTPIYLNALEMFATLDGE